MAKDGGQLSYYRKKNSNIFYSNFSFYWRVGKNVEGQPKEKQSWCYVDMMFVVDVRTFKFSCAGKWPSVLVLFRLLSIFTDPSFHFH